MKNLTKHIMAVIGAVALLALGISAAAAAAPGDIVPNDIPATARYVDGQTQSVPANGALWYKFDYSAAKDDDGNRDLATLTMQNATGTGLGFEVYTPAQIADWWEQKPIGQGTAQQIDTSDNMPAIYGDGQSSNLTWVGSFVDNGTYYVRVTNTTGSALDFVLNLQQ